MSKEKKKGCLRVFLIGFAVLVGIAIVSNYLEGRAFHSDKPQILKDARTALEEQNVQEVEKILEKYKHMNDSDLESINNDLENLKKKLSIEATAKAKRLRKERLVKELRDNTEPNERLSLLDELFDLEPTNEEFSNDFELVKQKRKQEEVKKKEELARRKKERLKKEAQRKALEKKKQAEAQKAKEEYQAKLNSQWYYKQSDDSMSKGKVYLAQLRSVNTVEFKFPYQGQQNASLRLRTHPRHGKDVIFLIEKGQILTSLTGSSKALIRFDDGTAEKFAYSGSSDHDSTYIFIKDYQRFVKKMLKAKKVKISVDIYQEGSPVFEFNVGEFSVEKYLNK